MMMLGDQSGDEAEGPSKTASSDINSRTKTSALRLRHAALDANHALVRADETFRMDDEPDPLALCRREQASTWPTTWPTRSTACASCLLRTRASEAIKS